MKYLYNPVTNDLDNLEEIEKKIENIKPIAKRTESLKTKEVPEVKPKTDVLDYIDRMQHVYEGKELNQNNKKLDAWQIKENKKNNIDPKRPSFSDNDVIFATMSPKEALEFTGGYDKEKIKFMREVKAQVHRQDAYDKKMLDSKSKRAAPTTTIKKEVTPVPINFDLDAAIIKVNEPIEVKPKVKDMDDGIAALLKINRKNFL